MGYEKDADVGRGWTGGPISDAQDPCHPRLCPEPLQGGKTTLTRFRAPFGVSRHMFLPVSTHLCLNWG